MRRVWLIRLAAAAAIALVVALIGRATAVNLTAIEGWIHDLGPWAFLAYVGVFLVLTTVFVPDTLLAIVAGAVFGMLWGTVAVSVAGLLAATVQYVLARTLFRGRIYAWLAGHPRFAAIQRALRHDQVKLQWCLRLTPFNPTTVSYLLGATGVRFGPYLLACLGLIPAFVVEVYVGHVGRNLASAADRREAVGPWHDVLMVAGLVACLLVVLWMARIARRAVRDAVARAHPEGELPAPADS